MKPEPLTQLRTFLTVARLRSFAGAARELGISRSAVSQSMLHLEKQLDVVLLARTTRSVSLTETGRKLVESAGPSLRQTLAALGEISARPGEAIGKLRLSVPRSAFPHVVEAVLPVFCERHPRIEVEIAVEDRFVDIVAEGYDAGVRLSEAIQRDMVQVRLTPSFRFVVVGAPSYVKRRGTPQRPEDLLAHECITFRLSTGALYAWELERGKRRWRVPVRGNVVTSDGATTAALARRGLGLAYASEPMVSSTIREKKLVRVLESYAPTVPGYFLYFPSSARKSTPLRLFLETARELTAPVVARV